MKRTSVDPDEFDLDPEQAEAVEALDGGLLLLAPVGSGKTKTLADRVVKAIARGIAADRILCVTFTNRAAEEMRTRVRSAVGDRGAKGVAVKTFHALCASVLHREHRRLGLPAEFTIVDEDDARELLQEAGAPRHRQDLQPFLDSLHASKSPPRSLGARHASLEIGVGPDALFADALPAARNVLARYQRALADRQALDFDDLVRLTRALFRGSPPIAAEWASRYDLVQVDEVQDVHEGEYEVVRHLAKASGRLALIGDIDQTIYGWRGSEPDRVLHFFGSDFAPVTTVTLRWNHRATKTLVRAADAVLTGLKGRRTHVVPAAHLEKGDPVVVHAAPDAAAEARWIAEEAKRLLDAGALPWRIGILARTNGRTLSLGRALLAAGVPHVTVEEYEFFRRQEVKDAMSLLRLVLRPDDSWAADRVLRRPPRGLGDAGIARFRSEGEAVGLRLVDLLSPAAVARCDPHFGALRDAAGAFVAIDTETTGLDPSKDEVIEVGAVRFEGGRETAAYSALVKPRGLVGASVSVHGLTDERLAAEGRPAGEVFRALAQFVGNAPIAGHNVQFDVRFIEADARRAGVSLSFHGVHDTLPLARRFVALATYDLGTLLSRYAIPAGSAHRALDDARGAGCLLVRLATEAAKGAGERAALMANVPEGVAALAATLTDLRAESVRLRPAELLALALSRAGLKAHYSGEPSRTANLDELTRALASRDDPLHPPAEALRAAVTFATLARNLSLEGIEEDRIPVVTVHQAKGLEFDSVFVAGVVEDEFPAFQSRQEGGERLAEEQRLFYVAVTRARRRLFLSWHARSERGFSREKSRYLRLLDPADVVES